MIQNDFLRTLNYDQYGSPLAGFPQSCQNRRDRVAGVGYCSPISVARI